MNSIIQDINSAIKRSRGEPYPAIVGLRLLGISQRTIAKRCALAAPLVNRLWHGKEPEPSQASQLWQMLQEAYENALQVLSEALVEQTNTDAEIRDFNNRIRGAKAILEDAGYEIE